MLTSFLLAKDGEYPHKFLTNISEPDPFHSNAFFIPLYATAFR